MVNSSSLTEPQENVALEEAIDLDDLLPQIGEFGRYQKLLLWLVCLPSCLPCGFGAFNQLFMVDTPEHWCKVPQLMNLTNVTQEERRRIAIPFEAGSNISFSKCSRYAMNWSDVLTEQMDPLSASESWNTEGCIDGWEYDVSQVESSIVIDFDLVCDYAVYPTLGLVALNIGGPVGVYMFGILTDQIGRKKSFFACLTTLMIGSLLTALAHEYWLWALARSIVGLTIPAIYQIPFIISLELVGPNYRSFITVMTCISYTFGLILLAGVTYMVRDWRILTLTTSVPFLLYYLYWFVMPESPRWLMMRGRLEEANKILESIAKVNGKPLPESFTTKLKKQVLEQSKHGKKNDSGSINMFALCKTPNLRLKTILITLNWCASEMVYVGLSYYGPAIGSNQYISFFLSSVVEIPSYIVCWIVMDRWGRRWPLCLSMVFSGIFCAITVMLPSDAVTSTLILFLISKSLISGSFLIIYPYAGELYPTELRGIGIGTSAYIGGLGLIVIPFINYLGTSNLVLPLLIMGIVSVLGGITALRLPETLNCKLPTTIEEGEEFGKDWSYADCCSCVTESPVDNKDSYEDLEQLELAHVADLQNDTAEKNIRRNSMKRLIRQTSVLETQRDVNGTIRMTYWF